MKKLNYLYKNYSLKLLLFIFVNLVFKNTIKCQVSLQTGSATFSLPMFNWQDDKSRLNSVVALNYSSGSGLKVNDVASNVGQGWNLLAGGVITRMQVGEPDDQKLPNNSLVNEITKYPAGYFYATGDPAKGCLNAVKNFPIYGDQNHLYKQHNIVAEDKELDYFSFTFNGRSGLFFLDKNSYDPASGTYMGVSLGDSKLKISFTIAEVAAASWKFRTTIQTFIIQDENGLIYRFGNLTNDASGNNYLGRTKILKTAYCDPDLTQPLTQPTFEDQGVYNESAFEDNTIVNPYTVDGWYLAEIEDALTHRKISLTYTPRNIHANSGVAIAHYSSDNKGYIVLSHKVSITTTPEISSIALPDGHNISFNYGNYRTDFTGDRILNSVDITYNSRYFAKYELKTSYFILNRYGTPVSDYQRKAARLCLLSVTKYGVDLKAAELPYKFDYYIGAGNTPNSADVFVPPPFFYAKDIWGYYNGSNSCDLYNTPVSLTASVTDLSCNDLTGLCYMRNNSSTIAINPKAGYAKNGLLKQIIYPTGGSLIYDYAQNEVAKNGQNIYWGGVHVASTRTTDGGYSNNCAHPLVTNYNYTLEKSPLSSLWGTETPVNSTTLTTHYSPESKYYYWKPFFGSCAYRFQYPGILAKEQAISVSNGQKTAAIVSTVSTVLNTITTIMDVANVIGGSTGFMAWASVAIDFICNALEVIFTCFTDQSKDYPTTVFYNSDLNSVNPLPAQFKRVEIDQNSATIGKTAEKFTSEDEYPVWEPSNAIYSVKQRYAYWAYGLPLVSTVYDNNGLKIKETENIYDPSFLKMPYKLIKSQVMKFPSCKTQVNDTYSQNSDDWVTPDLTSFTKDMTNAGLKAEIYNQITGRLQLAETKERVYKLNDETQFAETKTDYSYSFDNYQITEVATTQSNGDINYKSIKYPFDYQTGVLRTLYNNNIVNIPVETATYIIKKNVSGVQYLNEKVTEFTTLANGDIKPSKTLEQRFNQPTSSIGLYNGPGSASNPVYKITQTLTYDVLGNLVGMKDEGNHVVTNIYGYNDKYVIASVINADPVADNVAYTSFEAGDRGAWGLYGNNNIITTNSVTGINSFGLTSSNSLATPLNTSKSYKLSFWATNPVTVTGNATLIKSSPILNGFTYYEYNVAQGTSAVSVSGNANIDELRLYPQTARMRTVTYDPLIGKTSECDENNRITYYEYEELGRLRYIKDENRHIVKMYEYNYAKQNGCPAEYNNNAITEVFTKSGCSAGFVGSEKPYSIAYGAYKSTISQADADQQAENELNTKGQDYADQQGTCKQLYYNLAISQTFTKQGCPPGYKGSTITYSVPAGRYSSTIDTATVNKLARAEMRANGQAFANNDASAMCVESTEPNWQANDPASKRCHQDGGGNYNGHQEVYMRDVNTRSSTFNTWQWKDAGANTSDCPRTGCTAEGQKWIQDNCETGYQIFTGSVYRYGQWYCIYHYEWSDGSWSDDYYLATGNEAQFCITN